MHQLEGVIRLDGGIPRQTDGRQPMDDRTLTFRVSRLRTALGDILVFRRGVNVVLAALHSVLELGDPLTERTHHARQTVSEEQ